jgi:hypothetical protein
MKNNLIKSVLTLVFLFINFLSFAQGGPGDENDTGNLEGDDAPAAPINGKLIWLAILAIVFAYYIFKRERKVKVYN